MLNRHEWPSADGVESWRSASVHGASEWLDERAWMSASQAGLC
jgi:hypothetical protein